MARRGVASVERWGWVSHDGEPQVETFDTADAAIAAMAKRTGNSDNTLNEAMRVGFRLALLRVSVTIIATLAPTPPDPGHECG